MAEQGEKLTLAGRPRLVLRDKNGKVKVIRELDNIIVDTGFDFVCDVMGNTVQPADLGYTAIGTGTDAAATGDTKLGTESTRVTNSYGHTVGDKTYYTTATFGAGVGTGSITESGLLNATEAGTMLCRQTFAVINKGADDSLEVTWKITLS